MPRGSLHLPAWVEKMSIDSFGEDWLDGMFLEVDRKLTNMQNLELRGQPMSLRFAHAAADKSQHDFGEPEEHGTVAGGGICGGGNTRGTLRHRVGARLPTDFGNNGGISRPRQTAPVSAALSGHSELKNPHTRRSRSVTSKQFYRIKAQSS